MRHHLCQAGAGRGRGWGGLEDWKNFFYSPKSSASQLKVPGRGSGLLKGRLIGKDLDPGEDGGQEKKRATEDEMVGWHH